MKFRNIYVLCRDNVHAISNLQAKNIVLSGRNGVKVSGWNVAREAVLQLREIPALSLLADSLMESVPDFYKWRDTFDIGSDEWSRINNAKINLLRMMQDVKILYQATGQEMGEKVGLDIKLPAYNDFSEFVKYINDLEYILTKCPFLESKDEKLEFENVDVGTTWLTFFVVGAVTLTAGSVFLNNMASFVDKCMVVRSHYLTTEKQKINLEKERMEAEKKKAVLEYLDIMYKKEIDAAIEELEKLTGHEVTDADERSRIELAFQKMGELLDKGLQIYSTIDSPKEVKALFDPLEMKYIELGKKIELLVDKKDE